MGTRNRGRRQLSLHSELGALVWTIENMFCRSTCKTLERTVKILLQWLGSQVCSQTSQQSWRRQMPYDEDFTPSWFHISSRTYNYIDDSLTMITKTFYKKLFFVGCSIPIYFSYYLKFKQYNTLTFNVKNVCKILFH